MVLYQSCCGGDCLLPCLNMPFHAAHLVQPATQKWLQPSVKSLAEPLFAGV